MRLRATKKLMLIALLALPVAAGFADAGPTKGPKAFDKFQVPSSREEGVPGEETLSIECRANEKTYVLVKGDHKPVADLEVLVVDSEDRVVARDKPGGDLVGVVFVPARTGVFRIVIRNPAPLTRENPYNDCYLSIR